MPGDNTKTNWMQAAIGASSGAIGMGVQRLGVNYDNRKQREQQQKLMNMQIEAESRLMDIQNQKNLEMWEKTGYVGQKDQMKRAGINPALMYGMGGGGGQTIGGGMPNVTTATAENPKTSQGVGGMIGMGLQSAMLMAQIENIKADTKNKLSGSGKQDAETWMIDLQRQWEQWMQTYNPDTKQREVGNEQDSIKGRQAVAQSLGQEIQNRLTEKGIELEQGQIDKMVADILQRAQELTLMDRNTAVAELLAKFNTNWGNIIGKEALETLKGVIQLLPLGRIITGAKHVPVQGFRKH